MWRDAEGDWWCHLCEPPSDASCLSVSWEGHYCTRSLGHSGAHAACGPAEDEHPICQWFDPEPLTPQAA
jgi:hypothetical protein